MSRPLAVLRPEPGNAATVARIEALGHAAIAMPLFAVTPLDWTRPDPAGFDALLLTSANGVRRAGAGIAALATLPVYALGEATAVAANAAGLQVAYTGEGDGADLLAAARMSGVSRALLLAGRERRIDAGGIVARAIAVYAADPLPAPDIARLAESVALVHSARAGALLSELVEERGAIRLAAISRAAADADGSGWGEVAIAEQPRDAALIAAAIALAD